MSFQLKRRAWTKTEVLCPVVLECVSRRFGLWELRRLDLVTSSCPVWWGSIDKPWAWLWHARAQEVNGWVCIRGTEGQETNLEAAAWSKQERLWAFTFCFRLIRAFAGRCWILFSMTFKKMASELDADKLGAAARVPRGAPDALGLCSRSAGSRAQLSSAQSCQWLVEQWKKRIGNAVHWAASVCQHSARSFGCFHPL